MIKQYIFFEKWKLFRAFQVRYTAGVMQQSRKHQHENSLGRKEIRETNFRNSVNRL